MFLILQILDEPRCQCTIKIDATAVVFTKLITVGGNDVIDALTQHIRRHLCHLAKYLQRHGVQFRTYARYGIGAVMSLRRRCHEDDVGQIMGRLADAEQQGLSDLGLQGCETEFATLVMIDGEVDAAVAQVADPVEQDDGTCVAVLEDLVRERLPIKVDVFDVGHDDGAAGVRAR